MKLFGGRRAFLELSLIVFLLALSFALYLTLTRKGEREKGASAFRSKSRVEDGLNLYRLEDYERAGFVLRGVLEKHPSKREGSLAALYLGNISYLGGDYATALDFYKKAFALDKGNAFAIHNAALASLAKGEPDRALQYALRALRVDEDFAPSAVLAGNIYRVLGKYDRALAVYEKAQTGEGLVKFNEASVSLLLGNRDRAERLLNDLLDDRRSSNHQRSSTLAGLSHAVLGFMHRDRNRRKAVENLSSALETFPGSQSLRYDCALLLMKEGRYGEALSILKSIDAQNADRVASGEDFRKLLGVALFKRGNYREALEHYLSFYENGAGGEVASIIGDIYVKLGDLEEAKRYYGESIRGMSYAERPGDLTNSGGRGAFLNLVQIMIEEKRYEEAFRICSDLSGAAPQDPLPPLCMAKLHFAVGEKEKGIRALQQAALLSKDDLTVLLRIAALYGENGLANNALQIYHRVLSKDENNYSALAGIARIYRAGGHAEKARKALGKALQATADIDVYYDLSLNMAQLLDSEEAVPLYRNLIREFPYRFEAYQNLALVSLGMGDYETAERLVEQCFAANPRHPEKVRSDLFVIKGAAQQALGRSANAVQSFLRARQLDEKNPLPVLHLKEIEAGKRLP